MPVLDDQSGEIVRKAAEETTPGNSNNLIHKVRPSPFGLDVVRGNLPEFSDERIVGRVTDAGINIKNTIWGGGIAAFTFPTSAAVVSIVSDNANDTLLGTGAQTITLEGLDSSGDFITEDVDLDGVTPATTVATFTRLNMAIVSAAGTTGTNEGLITLTIGATRVGRILSEQNTMLNLIFSVANNRIAYILGGSASIIEDIDGTGVKQGQITLDIFPSSLPFFEFKQFVLQTNGTSKTVFDLPLPKKVSAGGDIVASLVAHKNDTKVIFELDLLIEDIS